MDYTIRKIKETEYPLLKDFLYEAIFVPDGAEPPPRSIVDAPELQVYVSGFGSEPHDLALIAEVNDKTIGAVWVRIMNDYGHIAGTDKPLSLFKKQITQLKCIAKSDLKLLLKTTRNTLW